MSGVEALELSALEVKLTGPMSAPFRVLAAAGPPKRAAALFACAARPVLGFFALFGRAAGAE